ncbi:3-isopropylmalate dehydratase small subunit [Alicyclobacillus sp. SO9]|uniref:3-isopropylmalate dehydratase small subunit n=1 Tax=Alicyclobacillus sp. SO9 TaxID=2665646 RepID=UPI0018E869E2|nr:3-isopropylmalate dehydratase small subunit [Alicyclobacillus sp. SO9]QQE77671.1 3-isopropylmalate dehydratase small subunit [Alicyclobacillus sp. SO9]
MEPFTQHKGTVAAFDRVNVDTDQIIPKQFLKRIERTGFGQFLFYDWRYDEKGNENPEFELNQPQFKGATILLAKDNFGCGSSREHAAWAIQDYGFHVVIAPSFADIFYNNCFKNGILPIQLPAEIVNSLFAKSAQGKYGLTVDLEKEQITDKDGLVSSFTVDPHRRSMMLKGLDDIGLTLQYDEAIKAYEQSKRASYQLLHS